MKKLLVLIFATIAIIGMLSPTLSQDNTADKDNPDYVAPLPPPDVDDLRDPFWPLGKSPKPVEVVRPLDTTKPAVVIKWNEAEKKIVVRSIGGSGSRVGAMIEGIKGTSGSSFVMKGENISVEYDGLIYRWKVTDIIPGKGITTKRLGVPKPIRK